MSEPVKRLAGLEGPQLTAGTLLWRLFVVALLLILIVLNVRVLRIKPAPVGREQGGAASLQHDMSGLEYRLKQDEKANAGLQQNLNVVANRLKITQGEL